MSHSSTNMPVSDAIPSKEVERQYRVLRQRLSMHAILREEFALKAKAAKILLLGCSAVLCATTFSSDDLYITLGVSPILGRIVLGIASLGTFILSLSLLVLDWDGQAASHTYAIKHLGKVLQGFRESRDEAGGWNKDVRAVLSETYWRADRIIVKIPDRRFNELKARYLRKVAISEMKDSYPNCPAIFLRLLLIKADLFRAMRQVRSSKKKV